MSFGRRMGTFSLTLGIFFILYFAYTANVGVPSIASLLGGFALVGLGILLLITHPLPRTDNGRFRIFRRKTGKKA
jgi:hypothetical protein